jgi:hypothetical protein
MRRFLTGVACTCALAAAACQEPLNVENPNDPDVQRAFATAQGVERLIGQSYQQVHVAIHGGNAIKPQLMTMSFESHAALGNFGMGLRAGMPRLPISNARGNQTATENLREFSLLQRNARSTADGIAALDRLREAKSNVLGSVGADLRARAFGFFALGASLAYAAMIYDSAAVVYPTTPTTEVPALSGYASVMTEAIKMLDTAIAIATSAAAVTDNATFTIPLGWLPTATYPTGFSRAEFIQLVRSFRARFRAGVARTTAERQAADWAAIIADAENGLQNDLAITLSISAGWRNLNIESQYRYEGWHQMPPVLIGMADTATAYDAYLALPLGARGPILIRTPDRRFPPGETRAAQQANSPNPPTGLLYFRNRPSGGDTPAEPWGTSFYDHNRFYTIFQSADKAGPWPDITRAELDLLAAEGYIRRDDFVRAAALIDTYRTRAGLPALSGVITARNQPVPGGTACVPQVPTAPSFTSANCGDIWEAMKWEKRLETAWTGYGQWYFDMRGWGDLPEGTPLHYPVPYQEMDARLVPFYDLGGVGGRDAAPKGTYGL